MSSAESDFLSSLEVWLQARFEEVHTSMPGQIQSYDPKTRLATVKPMVKFRSLHGDVLDIPPIDSVPVVWPGAKSFTAMGALESGDGGTLIFSESSLGNWLRGTTVADAEDETRFCLHDAIFVPGLWQSAKVPGHTLRTAKWGICDKDVVLGGADGKAVVKNETTDLRAELDKMWSAVNALANSVKVLAPLTGASPGTPCVPDAAQADIITALQSGTWTAAKTTLGKLLQ